MLCLPSAAMKGDPRCPAGGRSPRRGCGPRRGPRSNSEPLRSPRSCASRRRSGPPRSRGRRRSRSPRRRSGSTPPRRRRRSSGTASAPSGRSPRRCAPSSAPSAPGCRLAPRLALRRDLQRRSRVLGGHHGDADVGVLDDPLGDRRDPVELGVGRVLEERPTAARRAPSGRSGSRRPSAPPRRPPGAAARRPTPSIVQTSPCRTRVECSTRMRARLVTGADPQRRSYFRFLRFGLKVSVIRGTPVVSKAGQVFERRPGKCRGAASPASSVGHSVGCRRRPLLRRTGRRLLRLRLEPPSSSSRTPTVSAPPAPPVPSPPIPPSPPPAPGPSAVPGWPPGSPLTPLSPGAPEAPAAPPAPPPSKPLSPLPPPPPPPATIKRERSDAVLSERDTVRTSDAPPSPAGSDAGLSTRPAGSTPVGAPGPGGEPARSIASVASDLDEQRLAGLDREGAHGQPAEASRTSASTAAPRPPIATTRIFFTPLGILNLCSAPVKEKTRTWPMPQPAAPRTQRRPRRERRPAASTRTGSSLSPGRLHVRPDPSAHSHETGMKAAVVGQFRVERDREQGPRARRLERSRRGQDLHLGPVLLDPGRADEDRAQGLLPQPIDSQVLLEARELAAEGVLRRRCSRRFPEVCRESQTIIPAQVPRIGFRRRRGRGSPRRGRRDPSPSRSWWTRPPGSPGRRGRRAGRGADLAASAPSSRSIARAPRSPPGRRARRLAGVGPARTRRPRGPPAVPRCCRPPWAASSAISWPRIASPSSVEAVATRSGSLKCVVASTMARARRSGSSDLKMPEPTKLPSAPSCIISAASAGVAIPPAQKSGTGSQPRSGDLLDHVERRAGPWPRPRAPRGAAGRAA